MESRHHIHILPPVAGVGSPPIVEQGSQQICDFATAPAIRHTYASMAKDHSLDYLLHSNTSKGKTD